MGQLAPMIAFSVAIVTALAVATVTVKIAAAAALALGLAPVRDSKPEVWSSQRSRRQKGFQNLLTRRCYRCSSHLLHNSIYLYYTCAQLSRLGAILNSVSPSPFDVYGRSRLT